MEKVIQERFCDSHARPGHQQSPRVPSNPPLHYCQRYSLEFVLGSSDRCIFCSTGSVNVTLSIVSSYTLALMVVGRLLYLKKPLHYSSIVTPARVLALCDCVSCLHYRNSSSLLWIWQHSLLIYTIHMCSTITMEYPRST